jgi:acetoin utilization deacetylase AcuC-like enzyme/ankyrin repeat protein
MSPSPSGTGSDDESYSDYHHNTSFRNSAHDRRYPIHDACEYDDIEVLKSIMFVRKHSSKQNNFERDDDSQSDGSSNSSENDNGKVDTSDDDSSGTDGENDKAAAAAVAMGHHRGVVNTNPLLTSQQSTTVADQPIEQTVISQTNNPGLSNVDDSTQIVLTEKDNNSHGYMDISPVKLDMGENHVDNNGLMNVCTGESTDVVNVTPSSPKNTNDVSRDKDETITNSKPPAKLEYYCPYDLDERDLDENTPLHIAIHNRKLEHMQYLLEAGASPHRKCDGSYPIHTAISVGAISGHKSFACEAVELLLKFNANICARDDATHTPLYLAAVCNLPSVVGIILNDPDGVVSLNYRGDRMGGRALHAAAKFDTSKGVGSAVLRSPINRLDMNGMRSIEGATPVAVGASSKAILTQILLNTKGIEVDAKTNYGRTPLHVACSRGNWPVARLLLEAGANPKETDARGFTPGGLAYKRGMPIPNDLVSLLGPPGSGTPVGLNTPCAPLRDLIIDPEGSTLVVCHEVCSKHMTCPPITRDNLQGEEPPPENVRRLSVLINEEVGILRGGEFDGCKWNHSCRRVAMTDVLKVHEYSYVEKISHLCAQLPDHPMSIANLDADTALSRWSFEAAMRAAGSVCDAIDSIMAGDHRNAFCVVRPPGHHAGPRGIVRCANDPEGSHGFCLLNNVAIGAAYARSMYRNDGIKKVAIIDFDVHHGNGTEEIIRNLIPVVEKVNVQTSFASGYFETSRYRPWLDETDVNNVFFASTHGYGPRELRFADHLLPHQGGWFYPASGKTYTSEAVKTPTYSESPDLNEFLFSQTWARMGDEYRMNCCKIINIGLSLPTPDDIPGMQRVEVRDSYRKNILPQLVEFHPDIIFISAGFDAHKKDTMNFGYVGMVEEDYEWVTEQLVKVANTCCNGRIVSVLEGGYKIHGGIVSPFARSVASHLRALTEGGNNRELYDKNENEWESRFERNMIMEREHKRQIKMDRLNRAYAGLEPRRRMDHHMADISDSNLESRDKESGLIESNHYKSQPSDMIDEDEEGAPRKRRRNHVDYAKLYEEMKKEGLS